MKSGVQTIFDYTLARQNTQIEKFYCVFTRFEAY